MTRARAYRQRKPHLVVMEFSEIAARLGINESLVKWDFYNGMEKLRDNATMRQLYKDFI